MAKRRSNGLGTIFKLDAAGPWIVRYYDHAGRRKQRCTKTTDRKAAERILGKLTADAALRRDGVVDPMVDSFTTAERAPLSEHVEAYLAYCAHAEQNPKAVEEKRRHLSNLLAGTGATRLSALTADAMTRYMGGLRDRGLSARTANFARQAACAFLNWAERTRRVERNALAVVPKLDEDRDRRRVRRPLSDKELAALLDVAGDHGRRAWYMLAAMAGLRRGDLKRLKWGQVNFANGTITISDGKAKRTDILPMHDQLVEVLRELAAERPALPMAKVFTSEVMHLTVQKDLLRSGIARREPVLDAEGRPVMIGNGKRRHVKTRITTADAEGRVVDLHSLRTTLGTNMALAGVSPQLAQRMLRHADYRTTAKHYTVLQVQDVRHAVEALPRIEQAERLRATGTMDVSAFAGQQLSQQLGRETVQSGATGRNGAGSGAMWGSERKGLSSANLREPAHSGAAICGEAGEGTRTPNNQLGRLEL